ncbi:hypothetical protein [Deinococcus sp. Marseille-Q6407]|uniref:hypothetical protein n=1 Tax=Deinococcus sp. Marseille-Q6407 TaxID=2969223 RepID=UPI0021BF6FAF|nr:hypothetical protein [Deinococcus sp. Marseille-Q6407]
MQYHTSVTGALQTVARLSRSSPYVAPILAPVPKAVAIASRQAQRYPTITADHGTRTALRKVGLPVVQLVILPPDPDGENVPMLLMSNTPVGERETWSHVLDDDNEHPLEWRNYQLARGKRGAITWRLNTIAREHYRKRIARLITGRGGAPAPGERPYQLSDETAHAQVLKLADHLLHYPGLSGIRADIFDLAQYSTKLWRSTRPQTPYPVWPTMPYVRFMRPQTALLAQLALENTHDETQKENSP